MILFSNSKFQGTPLPLSFLYSFGAHLFLFLFLFFVLKKTSFQQEEKKNIVFMEIRSAPKVEPQKPPAPIPKTLPKAQPHPVLKKLVQESQTPSAPLVAQPLEKAPPTKAQPLAAPSAQEGDSLQKPLSEALVDKVARCKIPDVSLTEDAAHAGITSGRVLLEVLIQRDGKVSQVKLLKGTGFEIDRVIMALAEKMQCEPAQKEGKDVPVKQRLQWIIKRG